MRDTPTNVSLCAAPNFAGVQYFDGTEDGPAGYMDAEWSFVHGPGAGLSPALVDFLCEAVIDTIAAAITAVQPEFAGIDAEGDRELVALCEDGFELVDQSDGGGSK